MSKTEILSAIPSLSHEDRREIVRSILEAEVDAQTLADSDRLAMERFQMLDALE
jgi:FlaA1/EpsC-like NDP-sugar epimerase